MDSESEAEAAQWNPSKRSLPVGEHVRPSCRSPSASSPTAVVEGPKGESMTGSGRRLALSRAARSPDRPLAAKGHDPVSKSGSQLKTRRKKRQSKRRSDEAIEGSPLEWWGPRVRFGRCESAGGPVHCGPSQTDCAPLQRCFECPARGG